MAEREITAEAQLEALSTADFYRAVPVQNAKARQASVSEGLVLEIPFQRPRGGWRLLSLFLPLRETRRVLLDELGTVVYGLCDGALTVREMIEQFAERYRLTFLESRASLGLYLKQLLQRGAVAVMVKEDA